MILMVNKETIYSAREAAKQMGVTPNTITLWLRKGELRGVKRGKWWYVPESAIAEYVGLGAGDAEGI